MENDSSRRRCNGLRKGTYVQRPRFSNMKLREKDGTQKMSAIYLFHSPQRLQQIETRRHILGYPPLAMADKNMMKECVNKDA